MLRWLLAVVLLVVVVFAGVYVAAGRGAAPVLRVEKPDRVIGQAGTLDVTAEAPKARFLSLTIALEQNGRSTTLFQLNGPQAATIGQAGPNAIRISRPLNKQA